MNSKRQPIRKALVDVAHEYYQEAVACFRTFCYPPLVTLSNGNQFLYCVGYSEFDSHAFPVFESQAMKKICEVYFLFAILDFLFRTSILADEVVIFRECFPNFKLGRC